jgi:hypothetical protein
LVAAAVVGLYLGRPGAKRRKFTFEKLTFEKRTDLDGDQRPQHGSDKRLHHAG